MHRNNISGMNNILHFQFLTTMLNIRQMKMLRKVKWLQHATDTSCTTPLPDFYLLHIQTPYQIKHLCQRHLVFSISDFRTIWREIEKKKIIKH